MYINSQDHKHKSQLRDVMFFIIYYNINMYKIWKYDDNVTIQQILQFNNIKMSIQNQPIAHSPQQYEQDYQQQQEQGQLQVVIQQKQPNEQVISLKEQQRHKQNDGQQLNELRSNEDDLEQKSKLANKLKNVLASKIEQIKNAKKNIGNYKIEIKEIGEEVDKEMNKSILKHSKPYNSISIQSIFQNSKSSDPQINQLNAELAKVRSESKKIKNQLKTLENQVKAPVNLMNLERATEIRSKIKEIDAQFKKIKQEKDYLETELKIMEVEEGVDQMGNNQQIKANRQKNNQLLTQIKEGKAAIYDLQKEDRLLTQKIRYIQQLEQQAQTRKSRPTASSIINKQQLQNQIKSIVNEIKQIIDKRNKVQTEKKSTYKQLELDVSSMEAKNWDIINKLREIDAKLIKHYNSKLKKSKAKKQDMSVFQQQNSRIPIQNSGATIKTVYVGSKNDKNISPPKNQIQTIPMIEKRKNYQFFMHASENQNLGNFILNDQMLGNKLSIKKLTFLIDQVSLYGMCADYQNQHKNQVRGYKIMSRIKPKDIITKSIVIDNDKKQVINYIQVGVDKTDAIKYLHIVTSQAKQFKWGNLEICDRNEQKNIRKYENIVIKGKLNQISEKQAPNYYCLAGIGFSIVYLSAK